MKEFWDERYSQEEYVYGEFPNAFLQKSLGNYPPGKILFPAEGEGRNAVYAAALGWDVYAFDISNAGKIKADLLAKKQGVKIDYKVGSIEDLAYPELSLDALVLIFAHFPAALKSTYHQELARLLMPGAYIIFEGFSKNHLKFNFLNPKAGGPKEIGMLFSIEELKKDFHNFEFLEIEEKEVELNEGAYHQGMGAVIHFVARKLNR